MKKSSSITFLVPENLSGERVDKALASLEEISSRSRAAFLIENNFVLKNGKPVKPSYKVQLGDQIQIQIPEPIENILQPLDFKLDILFEDSDLIVVNKPSGLVVHPAAGHEQDTLVNALINHTKDLSMKFGECRPGIVHRLDKETSGILVVAKNDLAHEKLTEQFQNRSVHRIYFAVCIGKPIKQTGSMQSYLARHPSDRKRFASVRDRNNTLITDEKNPPNIGKWAKTNYTVIKKLNSNLSLLQLKLETGRTHQIRIHLSESGWPILGDSLYGADKKMKSLSKEIQSKVSNLNRFALHAAELGFVHPTTGSKLSFKVNWPEDIKILLKDLGLLE